MRNVTVVKDLFLSHSHADKRFVRQLSSDCKQRGISVWVDEAELLIGDLVWAHPNPTGVLEGPANHAKDVYCRRIIGLPDDTLRLEANRICLGSVPLPVFWTDTEIVDCRTRYVRITLWGPPNSTLRKD
jgi:hypothetical protein